MVLKFNSNADEENLLLAKKSKQVTVVYAK